MSALSSIDVFTLLVYVSIAFEIIVFPVPSEASTYQLLLNKNKRQSGYFIDKVRNMNPMLKISVLLLPALIGVMNYGMPLLFVFHEKFALHFSKIAFFNHIVFIAGGIILMVSGRFMSFYSVIIMRRNTEKDNPSTPLNRKGFYKITRNPILLGMHITFIGIFLIYPYLILIPGFIIYLGSMHFRVLLEEDYLNAKPGTDYLSYLNKTRRYL